MAYKDLILAKTPLEYWRFDLDNPATYVSDSEGSVNTDLEWMGPSQETLVTGIVGTGGTGKAVDYNGKGGFHRAFATAGSRASAATTIEGWFKFSGVTTEQTVLYSDFGIRLGFGNATTMRVWWGYGGGWRTQATVTLNPGLVTGTWYHMVMQVAGAAGVKVWINNVLVYNTTAFSDDTQIWNNATVAERFQIGAQYVTSATNILTGQGDEVAIYNGHLTTAQIEEHYNAGTSLPPVDVTFAASSLTANASMPAATVASGQGKTVTVTPVTATADVVAPVVTTTKSPTVQPTALTATASMPTAKAQALRTTNLDDQVVGNFAVIANVPGWNDNTPTPNLSVPVVTGTNKVLRFTASGTASWVSAVEHGEPWLAEWTGTAHAAEIDAVIQATSMPVISTNGGKYVFYDAGQALKIFYVASTTWEQLATFTHNIGMSQAKYLRVKVSDGRVRAKLWTGTEPTAWTLDVAHSAGAVPGAFAVGTEPKETTGQTTDITYISVATNGGTPVVPNPNTVVNATALTASATLPGGVVSTDSSAVIMPSPMTASAEWGLNGGTTDRTVGVSALLATAEWQNATVSGGNDLTVTVAPITASATLVNAVFSNVTDKLVYGSAFRASMGELKGYFGEYAEERDPYYQRLLTQSKDIWLHLEETAGTDVEVRTNEFGGDHDSFLVPFRGGSIQPVEAEYRRKAVQFNGSTNYIDLSGVAIQSSPTSTNLYGDEHFEVVFRTTKANQVLWTTSNRNGATQTFRMEEGRLVIPMYSSVFDLRPYTPTRILNDGEWHHLVLRIDQDRKRFQVFVDGKIVFTRLLTITDLTAGWFQPNYIGRGTTVNDFFEGDIAEFVFDSKAVYTDDDVIENYYAYSNTDPIRVGSMTALSSLVHAKAKGNQKRALMLVDGSKYVNGNLRTDEFDWNGVQTANRINATMYSTISGERTFESFDLYGYRVFAQSIHAMPGAYDYFRVEETGERRYINLQTDIDVSEYDMIFFYDAPGTDKNSVVKTKMFEDLMKSVKDAIYDHQMDIWVGQPEIAIGLGLVDEVAAHTVHLNQSGDRHAQLRDAADGMTVFARNDYINRHALNKRRVVATVDEITGPGGWIATDWQQYHDPSESLIENLSYQAIEYEPRNEGLQIGDELYYEGYGPAIDKTLMPSIWGVPGHRGHRGLALTKEQTHYYDAYTGQRRENPYANWVTSIVVRPEDTVDGRAFGGRAVIDFMSGAPQYIREWVRLEDRNVDGGIHLSSGASNPSAGWAIEELPYDARGHARDLKTGWDLDTRRQTFERTDIAATPTFDPSGVFIGYKQSFAFTVKYPINMAHYWKIHAWHERLFNWLQAKPELLPGEAIGRGTVLTASARMPNATVVAEAQTIVNAEPMRALAKLVRPPQIADPDATVTDLPMRARATFGTYQKVVYAAPMTATATMSENFTLASTGEDEVLYISTIDITLYVKEDM